MECKKCGFFLDPFMEECPRCARAKADGTYVEDVPKPQTAQPAQRPVSLNGSPGVVRPQGVPPTLRSAPSASASSGSVNFQIKQIIGIVGGLMLLLGVFTPSINAPGGGLGISLWNISSAVSSISSFIPAEIASKIGGLLFFLKSVGIVLVVFSVGAIIVSAIRAYQWLWATAGGALAFIAFGFISLFQAAATLKSLIPSPPSGMGMGSTPVAAPTMSMPPVTSFLGIGLILLFLGIVTNIVAACLPTQE